MPFIGGAAEANPNLASEKIYRCPSDTSIPKQFVDSAAIDGVENRTSHLMNSLLSHDGRREAAQRFFEALAQSDWSAAYAQLHPASQGKARRSELSKTR